jgi:glycosyltransferase involved in cell wall biosynthesis
MSPQKLERSQLPTEQCKVTADAALALEPDVFISIIVCTYGRAAALKQLLNALKCQTYRKFEVLVIDGNQTPSPAREVVEAHLKNSIASNDVLLVHSERGLTRQRNLGLRAAKGDIVCFLDDDVTFGDDFLLEVAELFERSDMSDVGGVTGYDTLHYPAHMNLRWRFRSWFGVMPGLDPGRVDHLGRAVPLSFLEPCSGCKEIGWLAGFCMIYRRSALKDLFFDELLPTYGGEDRDFSMRVGQSHRLLMCGDLKIKHHSSVEGREDDLCRLVESSFGVGRRFGKYAKGVRDYLTMIHTVLGDLVIDLLVFVVSLRARNLRIAFVRIQAFWAGFRSAWTKKVLIEPTEEIQ